MPHRALQACMHAKNWGLLRRRPTELCHRPAHRHRSTCRPALLLCGRQRQRASASRPCMAAFRPHSLLWQLSASPGCPQPPGAELRGGVPTSKLKHCSGNLRASPRWRDAYVSRRPPALCIRSAETGRRQRRYQMPNKGRFQLTIWKEALAANTKCGGKAKGVVKVGVPGGTARHKNCGSGSLAFRLQLHRGRAPAHSGQAGSRCWNCP